MTPRLNVLSASVFYGVLLGLALLWGALRGDVNVFVLSSDSRATWAPAVIYRVFIGIGVGLVAVFAARLLARQAWARDLNAQFRELLGPLSLTQVSILAVASAVGEEAFFRGAMQPDLGWVLTGVIFGLLHMGPGRQFWPWTVSALGMGFILGGLTYFTGDLLAATLAHFTVNYFNLWQLSSGALG
jgi:membrane protease YdiL (CAAX protease family)